ncbi:MAG: response regulator [Micavibrio sp.]|nr:response regulator [Micavibrio sp.]
MSDTPYKIALIEDDKFVAQAIKTFVSRKGFEVFHAENGSIGLDVINESKPHVILCERNMPEMSGTATISPYGYKLFHFASNAWIINRLWHRYGNEFMRLRLCALGQLIF